MEINVSNVLKLINFMERLDDPDFTMGRFFHRCGSPACALGWATKLFGGTKSNVGMDYSTRIFGAEAYWHLFDGFRHGHIKTPQQWATHARQFLKDNGLETQPDGFDAFMKKILKPVDLLEKA